MDKGARNGIGKSLFCVKAHTHFWKKVSKMVPGKSAQECFDKVHSDLTTPPQPKPRSRAKRTNSNVVENGGKNIEIAVMKKDDGLRQLEEAEIDAIVGDIEAEKAAAGAAKRGPQRED